MGVLAHLEPGQVISSFASDGWDNTPAAGAIGDQDTLAKVAEKNLDPQAALDGHSSLAFFTSAADTIQTGRLASNVADLYIVFKSKP